MRSRKIISLALAATMALFPAMRVDADAGNIAAGIVGGIIGGAIVNNNNRRPPRATTRTTPRRTGVSSATRAANRETQTALNYFGYPAGTPDGVLGRRSRAAISGMQAFLSFPVTGDLTPFERDILVGAYHRGISGTPDTVRLISTDPLGPRALLQAQKDLMTGATTVTRTTGYAGLPIEVSEAVDEIANSSDPSAEQLLQRSGFIQLADLNGDGNNDYILDTSFSGSSFWCSAVQCKSIVFVSTAQGYSRNDLLAFDPTPASFDCIGSSCRVAEQTVMASTESAPAAEPEQPATTMALGTLPLLAAPETMQASLSSHCSKVSILTGANGGYTEATATTDPTLVINEQFCLARAYAMDDADRMVAGMQGISQAQVDAQCAAYGPALKEYVAGLSIKKRDAVIQDVSSFVLSSGMDAAQLGLTAKVCLGMGYRTDDMDIALGSALLLIVLGESAYAELPGHHLSQGFGAAKRTDYALDWYADALDALAGGAQSVFAPNQPDRVRLLDAAVTTMRGGSQADLAPSTSGTSAKTGTSTLPTFKVKN